MIIMYSKPECPNCDKAVSMLQLAGRQFRTVDVGVDMTVEHFKQQFPEIRMMPFFVTNKGQYITTLIRLGEYLKETK